MALIKTPQEIEIMAEGGRILAAILRRVAEAVKPGVSTIELDKLAREEIKKAGVKSAFEGYRIGADSPAYPAVLCSSIDHEVVHGIPSRKVILKQGQIIGLDFGVIYKGLYTDSAITIGVGSISIEDAKLLKATREALYAGIDQVKPGNKIGDVAAAVEAVAKQYAFSVVRDLIGHGVGHALHEKPDVPNYGRAGTLDELKPGMVIAIEPMFTRGDWRINFADDGWTVVTADGSRAAHFEHSVAVTNSGHRVLTE